MGFAIWERAPPNHHSGTHFPLGWAFVLQTWLRNQPPEEFFPYPTCGSHPWEI